MRRRKENVNAICQLFICCGHSVLRAGVYHSSRRFLASFLIDHFRLLFPLDIHSFLLIGWPCKDITLKAAVTPGIIQRRGSGNLVQNASVALRLQSSDLLRRTAQCDSRPHCLAKRSASYFTEFVWNQNGYSLTSHSGFPHLVRSAFFSML